MNQILYQRICKLIAMNYALNENDVWLVYQHFNSIDRIIEFCYNNEIETIIKEVKNET